MKSSIHPRVLQAFLAASALSLGLAHAADPQPMPPPGSELRFMAFDLNRDGYIDGKEATGFPEVSRLLNSGDANSDGKLSEKEFVGALRQSAR
ncbi:MAG: EF-hand domain-containing protein [Moraxellaceae bacterium]|nr:EF-hand domain-containing protein [Moraxellaceae bacterium]